MRSLLDAEEEVDDKESEITLSTASLLGIFFGLVLICGVFFGFGYSMGRGTGIPAPANKALSASGASEPEVAASTPAPVVPERAEPTAPLQASPAPLRQADDTPKDEAPRLVVPLKKPNAARNNPDVESPAVVAANMNAIAASDSKPMVQIAAVARSEDANVLVTALRQRGYSVVVRSEPQDKLLHVQVGPFADRNQAVAIKQKLMADGYNAIIKQ
jgi:DedD protein